MLPTTLLAHAVPRPAPMRRPRAPRAAAGEAAGGWSWTRAAAVAVVAVVVGGLAFLRAWPPLATVMSASMAPTINTGDMVLLQRLRGPARIGDVVEVSVPDEARSRYGYPPVVIHRVFAISPDGQVRTKGDARPEPDPFTVPRTALTTRVVAHLPGGGRVLAFFHSAPGLLWLVFGAALFLGLPLLDRRREARRHEQDAAKALRAELESVTGELAALRSDIEARPEPPAELHVMAEQLGRLPALIEHALAGTVAPAPAV